MSSVASAKKIIANAISRAQNLAARFGEPGLHKRDHWLDYGYPTHPNFDDFYRMATRNGFGQAGVERIVDKCWQDEPCIVEGEDTHDETPREREVRERFERLSLWQHLKEADRRARIGKYAGVVLRYADGKLLRDPVTSVPGGLQGLVEVIPLYQPQLQVSEWDTDERSPTYGWPTMYRLIESAVDPQKERNRSTMVHPDRVFIWSRDGSVWGDSALKAGYNALVTLEKTVGAAGEGFWKGAKNSPFLSVDKDAQLDTLAQMLGTDVEGIADKVDEQVTDWQRGFDAMMMLQGIEARSMQPTLPQNPEQYIMPAMQEFCASIPIPMKILLGSQSGERASTEDAHEWGQTAMSRRETFLIPAIRRLVEKLEGARVLPSADWQVDWSDLTEASISEKLDTATKMATVNQQMAVTGGQVYTHDEIRDVTGYEPLDDNEESFRDDIDDLEDE